MNLEPVWRELIAQGHKGRSSHREPPPYWAGEPLLGKRVLLWCDQGIGDEILYASMIPELIAIAKHVTVETEARLIPIFQRSFPQANVVMRNYGGTEHDFQMSLVQLGSYLRPDTTHFPFRLGYLTPSHMTRDFHSDLTTRAWHEDIVGIAWRSSNRANGELKSAHAFEFDELFKRPEAFVASLQYGEVEPEVKGLPIYVHPLIDQVESLDDAFAQVAAMDYVITTSNTTAHIAGSLGKRTYLLLPDVAPDKLPWYWGAGDATPWYPSMKIFRGEGEQWCRTALSKALRTI